MVAAGRQQADRRQQAERMGSQAGLLAAHTCLQRWEKQHRNSGDHLQTDPAAMQYKKTFKQLLALATMFLMSHC